MQAMKQQRLQLSSSRARAPRLASRVPFRPVADLSTSNARPSVDPMAAATGPYQAGQPFAVHSPEEWQQQLKSHPDKLIVLMCKASHCKPCKAFQKKYNMIAAYCPDTAFLEVTGDETKDTRKMMMEMAVKATPAFRFYRNGEFLGQVTGTKLHVVLPAINERLEAGEKSTDGLVFPEEEPSA